MNKLILYTFCLLSVISIVSTIEISCAYSVLHYYMLRNVYSCVIRRVNSPENPIVQVSGFHMHAKNNDEVQGLKGDIGNVDKFPRDIKNTFKNLTAIYFTNGQIKELSSDDLKPFPELVELYFDNNKIEVIEAGTFDFNSKLAGISFMNNKVIHINANVFDHLTDLKYLWLNGNQCSNDEARNDRNAVLDLIAATKSTCQNQVFLRMENKLNESGIKRGRNLDTSGNLEQKIDNLEAKMDIHDQSFEEFKAAITKRINDLEVDYKNKHSEMMHAFQQKLKN
ncbi:hypothetical protein ACKWTF_012938 [Chironomus riparius]